MKILFVTLVKVNAKPTSSRAAIESIVPKSNATLDTVTVAAEFV